MSLDDAWNDVVAAIPKDWEWSISQAGEAWYGEAHPAPPYDEWDERGVDVMEQTPASTLKALAALLRDAVVPE